MDVHFRGKTVKIKPTTQSHSRRAQQFENKIRTVLKHLGCHPDDFEFSNVRLAMKKEEAWVKFWSEFDHCHISHGAQANYADNMQVIAQLLTLEEQEIERGELTKDQFFEKYIEEDDVEEERKEARKTLGVPEDCKDWKVIDKAYKDLARTAHPDMGGSAEEFKKLNKAHKVLRRELT
ncbi:MAG: J domain-containing protein [Candidatus Nanoarchaeia archaeon]